VRSSGQNSEFADPCQMRTTWPRKQVLGRETPGDFAYVIFIFEFLLYPLIPFSTHDFETVIVHFRVILFQVIIGG
jgi:hypothetical protein